MNTTLAVVVSAIVILITALVVITIFSGGMQQIGTITQARTACQSDFMIYCQSTGQQTMTWGIPNKNVNGEMKSCADVVSCTCNGKGTAAEPYKATCTTLST